MKDITMLPFQCATKVRFLHGTSNQLTPVLHKKLFWQKKYIYIQHEEQICFRSKTVRSHRVRSLMLDSCTYFPAQVAQLLFHNVCRELRSLNGRMILIVFALLRSFLMAVLIKFGGCFQNTSLSRSHSSWKSDQSEGNLYARSSMELNRLRLCRISTWLWW